MHRNLTFLNSFSFISEDTFSKLAAISTFKKVNSGVQLAKEGEQPTKLYMLLTGVVRAYLGDEKGKEYNKNFFMAPSFVGSYTALIKREPSKLVYETLTDCKVYEIDYSSFMKLCETDICVSNLYNRVLEHLFIKHESRHLDLISMDATQRYLKLNKEIPELEVLVPQYQIAAYLSVTPVQLSRIRKKLKEEEGISS
ncbi:Crp/Fnr family transcriptional regulator [Tamlana fucoidanivorans]|uniref:Crp/Fnr family transcriptional regulator n=1 Tax=Allotamlana fucoidanivorans TaxID=2583814 RepID=A0A5C4SQF2_9FLAO|nr:Crp/Fnr family transcriptional regulator [Tamlana fucoidanivorans]TNJ46538.1 Crp/Fnr family transcriptional regulator [Tamlana fucoidanivorans]